MTRPKANSAAGAVQAMAGALTTIEPPAGIKIVAAVRPFWDLVVSNKAASLWNDYDLFVAYEIATSMHRLSLANDELRKLALPAFDKERLDIEKLCDLLAKRIRLLSAHVAIHSDAVNGKAERQVARNQAHTTASNAIRGLDNEAQPDSQSLIPGLSDYRKTN